MKGVLGVASALLAGAFFASYGRFSAWKHYLDSARNSDVAWHAGIAGVYPTIDSLQSRGLGYPGALVDDLLLEGLDDPERFVLAHVVLSMAHCDGVEWKGAWNGMEYPVAGQAFSPTQRVRLKAWWLAKLYESRFRRGECSGR